MGDLTAIVLKMIEEAAATRQAEHLVTAKEAMETLQVSKTTLWRWEKLGYLVPVRVGGGNRYKYSDIQRIMEGGIDR